MAINFLDGISVNGLSTQGSESTALVINGSNVVGTRELGSNAFNSTTIPTNAVLTTGTQTVAGVKTFSDDTKFSQNVGINGATSIDTPLDIAASSTANNATYQKWYYAANNESYTLTLKQTVTSGVVRYNYSMVNSSTAYDDVLVLDRGNVGIGVTSPSQKLEVSGKAKITTSLAVGAITPSATAGRIDASNDVVAFSTSDIRLKDNIKTIDNALDKVNSIQGIEFDWIEKEKVHGNSGHDIGVIAQEIEKILPDVVTTRDNGYKAVKYEKIVPLLIEAIKELTNEVNKLKNK